jgi:hypothetical protein
MTDLIDCLVRYLTYKFVIHRHLYSGEVDVLDSEKFVSKLACEGSERTIPKYMFHATVWK